MNLQHLESLDAITSASATRHGAALKWLIARERVRDVAREAVEQAVAKTGEPAILALNRLGALDDEDLQEAFCALTGYPAAVSACPDLAEKSADLECLSARFLSANRAVILSVAEDQVRLGLVDPWNQTAIDGVRFALKRPVTVEVLLAREERRSRSGKPLDVAKNEMAEETSREVVRKALDFDRNSLVARRVSGWLTDAVEMRASDVHIEPRSNQLEVRYRVDGRLALVASETIEIASGILARIKVLADLDLGERRKPQDGRATVIVSGRKVDIRVSIVPSVHGEAAVLRILDRGEVRLDFRALGFSDPQRSRLEQTLTMPHGLVLVTGPTGSGKTTTLYAGLNALAGTGKKILTIEDPVEFHFDHVTQVQVAAKAGVTFASSIRAFLRQDPDIIFVGEVRDTETARTAVEAALTGHLVLATLHAIDVETAVPRLVDMGVERAQLSACLRAIFSQRLVRRLCQRCAKPDVVSLREAGLLGITAGSPIKRNGHGCAACDQTAYHGRLAIVESLAIGEAEAQTIKLGEHSHATLKPSTRMLDEGFGLVSQGLTTIEEVEAALADAS